MMKTLAMSLALLATVPRIDVRAIINALLNPYKPQTITGVVIDGERCEGIPHAWVQVFTYTQGFSRKGDFGLSAESAYECTCDAQGHFQTKITAAFGSMLVLAGHQGYGRAEFRVSPNRPLRIALGPFEENNPRLRSRLVLIWAGRGVTQRGWRFADQTAVGATDSADVWFDWRDLKAGRVRVSAGEGARLLYIDESQLCNSMSRLSAVCRAPSEGYSRTIGSRKSGAKGLIIVQTKDGHVAKVDWDEDQVRQLLSRSNGLQMASYYNAGAGDGLCAVRGPLRLQEGD